MPVEEYLDVISKLPSNLSIGKCLKNCWYMIHYQVKGLFDDHSMFQLVITFFEDT